MESTWEGRDLPVLEKIVDFYDQFGGSPDPSDLAEMLGWYEQYEDDDDAFEDVQRALRALAHEEPRFLTDVHESASGDITGIGAPTGYARRTVGAWPTPDALADRIIAALNEAADNEPDEEKKGRLRRAAEAIGGVGKGVLTDVMAQVVTRGMYGS